VKILVLIASIALLAPIAASADEAAVPGHFVLARASEDALVLFDASPEVAAIVSNKTPDADANDALERDALKVLALMLPKLEKSTKSVTVRLTYNKSGAVSPVYGAPTFAGVERYALLEVTYKDAAVDRDKWKELDPKHAVPPWISFKVIGQLPPR
jgi:hypothetical protein